MLRIGVIGPSEKEIAGLIPFVVIRSMSDNADEKSSEQFKINAETVAQNSIKVVDGLIRKLSLSLV